MQKDTLIGAFFAAAGMNRRRGRAYFNAIDISPGQPRIFRYLDAHDGCIQRDLAIHCHLEPASVTSVLSTMENKGYITRITVENDKRAQRVWLTEKGRTQCENCDLVFSKLEEEFFFNFTPEERQKLKEFLDRMCINMQNAEDSQNQHG